MQDYSVFNDYKYINKKYEFLDELSYPLRAACGGRQIDLIKKEEHSVYPLAQRVVLFIISFVIFPIGLVSGVCLMIKAFCVEDKKRVNQFLAQQGGIEEREPLIEDPRDEGETREREQIDIHETLVVSSLVVSPDLELKAASLNIDDAMQSPISASSPHLKPSALLSDQLCSTEVMLAEAQACMEKLTKLEMSQDPLWEFLEVCIDLRKYKEAISYLSSHPNDRHARFSFYLRYGYYPDAIIKLQNASLSESICGLTVELFTQGRSQVLEKFLLLSDLSSEDLHAPLFEYGPNAKWSILEELATGFDKSLLELALKKGCSPNQQSKDKYGNTPITWSIANNSNFITESIIKYCRDHKIALDLNIPSLFNLNTPLILCIAKGHPARPKRISNFELAQILLSSGADVNKADALINTPLHYACMRRDPDIIRLLCKYNPNLNVKNRDGETPFDCLKKDFESVQAILRYVTGEDGQGCYSFNEKDHCSEERTKEARMALFEHFQGDSGGCAQKF